MSWIYKGVVFTSEMIPEGAVGFIYEMTAIIDGKSVAYIGKKNFALATKKKLAKKNVPVDKRKKNYVKTSKLNYENYFSSNVVLKQAHKDKVPIKRNILHICYSKTELTYMETKYQFVKGVLESDYYLNGNILGRFYKQKY